jgi:hypothetical protein
LKSPGFDLTNHFPISSKVQPSDQIDVSAEFGEVIILTDGSRLLFPSATANDTETGVETGSLIWILVGSISLFVLLIALALIIRFRVLWKPRSALSEGSGIEVEAEIYGIDPEDQVFVTEVAPSSDEDWLPWNDDFLPE